MIVQVYDISGSRVYDPERAIDYATAIQFSTMWPKGYDVATFQVRRSDVFANWIVRESYGVKIMDGPTIVFQGRIETMPKDLQGTDEYVTIHCVGWYCVLAEREIRKRWIDTKGIASLRWPDGLETNEIQTGFINTKRDTILQVFMGSGDINRVAGQTYRELYELPAGYVRRIVFDYAIRSGEFINIIVFNVDNPNAGSLPNFGWEWFTTAGRLFRSDTNVPVLFQLGNTRSFEFRWRITQTDLHDQNDFGHISNLRVEATYENGHRNASNPTYTSGQLVEDIILLVNQKGAQLSTDFSQLGDPALTLDPFAIEEPTYAGPAIEKIAAYGDAALNTWGLCVWDDSDTSDGKPRVVFEKRDVSTHDIEAELSAEQMAGLNYEKISDGLYNNVTVQFINERDEVRYRTAADNAALSDPDSIGSEYQRDYSMKIGQGDATRADYVGRRFIQYHKDRVTRGTVALQGLVTKSDKSLMPVSRVRAGYRFKLLNTGEIFFIRHTNYDDQTETNRISLDQPVDNVAMLFAQRERGLGRLA